MSYGTGRIERCTDNRPPFRTSAHKGGNRPHYSHSSNGLRLTAPFDIDDTIGQFAALEIVGDAGFSFGVGAWAQNTMGFGHGYMYDRPLNTQFFDHVDPLTGSEWQFERKTPEPNHWRVHDDANGVRCMRTDVDGGHGFGFDTGVPTPPNTIVFVSSLVTATYSNPNTVENLQWKSVRIQNALNLGDDAMNSLYHKTFDKSFDLNQRGITTRYSNDGGITRAARNCYAMHHPVHDGIPTLQEVIAFNGTPDNYDAWLKTNEVKQGTGPYNTKLGDGGDIINTPGAPYDLRLTYSFSDATWRTTFFQDYYDEAESGDQTLLRYYNLVQYGSAERILVGDNSDPYQCQAPAHVLPIIRHLGSNIVIIPWYKGLMNSIANKHLHYFNDEGVYSGSIQAVV